MNKLLQKLTYGHYILTALKEGEDLKTRDNDYIAAGTVNWASQVSFEPEMLAVAVGQMSDLNETIDYSGHFTLHILGKDHKEMVEKFGSKSKVEANTINGVPFTKEKGEVVLENTLGYVTCKVTETVNVGDHTVHFGEVVRQNLQRDSEPICTMELTSQYKKEDLETA
ncbi:MAG: flavin reductase family protein [Cryomorphaceae bacterium]|nr:flavin reductase family protein [Flavobacteriales bacterium]